MQTQLLFLKSLYNRIFKETILCMLLGTEPRVFALTEQHCITELDSQDFYTFCFEIRSLEIA